MKPHGIKIVITVGAFALGVAAARAYLRPGEPVYLGRRLDFWLSSLPCTMPAAAISGGAGGGYLVGRPGTAWLSPEAARTRRGSALKVEPEAFVAIERAGTNSLPTLLRRLRARETALERLARQLERRTVWIGLIPSESYSADFRRWQAVTALLRLRDVGLLAPGSANLAALTPELRALSADPDQAINGVARFLLQQFDPDAAKAAPGPPKSFQPAH